MGKRQKAAQLTRQKILDTIKDYLQQEQKFTVEDITNKAGVAKGTFYIYFKNKEEAIFEITHNKFFQISNSLINSNDSIFERLEYFLKESARIIEETGLSSTKQWLKVAVSPEKVSKGLDKYRYDLNIIKKFLKDGIKSGELKASLSVDNIALEIVCEYYGCVSIWCLTNGKKDLIQLIDFYCNSSLKDLINNLKREEKWKK